MAIRPVKDTRSAEEIAIQSAITSHYNILVPGYKAQNIRIKNPLTGKEWNLLSMTYSMILLNLV
jgi:hypothetical protein